MELLYNLVSTNETEKKDLYIKDLDNKTRDYITYFNSFSLGKWKKYTSLKTLALKLYINGKADIVFYGVSSDGKREFDRISGAEGEVIYTFPLDSIGEDIVGFQAVDCIGKTGSISGGYYGDFEEWNPISIGIGICTYRRESYVKNTLATLKEISEKSPWLETVVIDNGSTLEDDKDSSVRILKNPNYGGSGGFARALLEYVKEDKVDYVLLMDDDIVLEPSVIERTRSFVSGLKKEYTDCFISGAMLSMEKPCIQCERTAYWTGMKICSNGKNLDLSKSQNLLRNDAICYRDNTYAAWWYCCMPLARIRSNGYPLPIFIKGDDMEYGIRNDREIISFNGVGVWHEAFKRKESALIRYFGSRNMMIINHYVKSPQRLKQMAGIAGRLVKQILTYGAPGMKAMMLSLRDYCHGMNEIVAVGSDLKMKMVKEELKESSTIYDFLHTVYYMMYVLLLFDRIGAGYIEFRKHNLNDEQFWREFLAKGEV